MTNQEIREAIINADIKAPLFEYVRKSGKVPINKPGMTKEEVENWLDEIHDFYIKDGKEHNDMAVFAITRLNLHIIARDFIMDYLKHYLTIPAHRQEDTWDRIDDALQEITPDEVVARIPWRDWKELFVGND